MKKIFLVMGLVILICVGLFAMPIVGSGNVELYTVQPNGDILVKINGTDFLLVEENNKAYKTNLSLIIYADSLDLTVSVYSNTTRVVEGNTYDAIGVFQVGSQ